MRLLGKELLHRYPVGFSLIDFGCGDGSALFNLADYLCELAPQASQNTRLVGVDIDEELISTGNKRVKSRVGGPEILMRVANVATDTVDLRGMQVLFVYLLPEALVTLRGVIEAAATVVDVVVSNRWDVPYLSAFPVARIASFYVYDVKIRPRSTVTSY